jgi:cyclohexa-1,5-dienecarbonyl-CoA hydratase
VTEASPLKDWLEQDGALLRLRLARPKANIVDAAMIAALSGAFVAYRGNPVLRGVLLDAEGPHFSFGASVEEHLPERCAAMLASLHALILAMVEFPVPILVAVRGQCLGGGLEVALAGGLIFAAPDAQLGQPEMQLGVFAPAASVLLPYRVNRPAAEDLLFSGRSVSGAEAACTRSPTIRKLRRSPTSTAISRARAPPRSRARWRPRAARSSPPSAAVSPRSNASTSTA